MRARGALTGEPPPWWTGTIEDEFTPIYMAMAQPSVLHDSFPPPLVDAMDLTTIWALMGIAKHERDRAEAVEEYRAAEPDVAMVPLTDAEKAERLARRRSIEASRVDERRQGAPVAG